MSGITQLLEPFPGALVADGQPIVLLALAADQNGVIEGVYVDADGRLGRKSIKEISIDWRYSWKERAWIDASHIEGDDGST